MRVCIVSLLAGCVVVFLCAFCLYAQKTQQEQSISNNPEYWSLVAKIEAVSSEARRSNAEASQKLDQVLRNQEKILSELAIVKVRATMAR